MHHGFALTPPWDPGPPVQGQGGDSPLDVFLQGLTYTPSISLLHPKVPWKANQSQLKGVCVVHNETEDFFRKMSTCFNDLQYQHNYVGVYCTLWTFPTIYAQFENDSCRLTRLSLALNSSLCICRAHIYEINNSFRRWNDKVYFASFSKTDKQIRKLREHRSSQYLQYSAHSMSGSQA